MGKKESPEMNPQLHWNLVLIEVASYVRQVKMNVFINGISATGKQAGDQ